MPKNTPVSEEQETPVTPKPAKASKPVKKEMAALEIPGPNDAIAANTAHVPRGGKAEAMRDKLKAEPKVRVLIPLANGEKAGVTQSVILNGYSLYIRKGDYVEVPQSVADVLDVKLKHKLAVDNHPLRTDGNKPVKMDVYGS